MYRTATLAAYDVMTNVYVTCTVKTYSTEGETPTLLEESMHSVTFDGTGEPNDERWLSTALIELAKSL